MKLITETNYDIAVNKNESEHLFIEGVFTTANTKNKNGRIYPKHLLEREIDKLRYNIAEKTSLGELEHPTSPSVNLDRAAILIEDLVWKGNDVYGKAKVLSTPCGQIVKNLIEDGVKLGISSRGLGTVNESNNHVNEDFNLLTWDVVANPSNYGSWISGICESVEFPNPNQDKLVEQAKEEYRKKIFQVIEQIGKNF